MSVKNRLKRLARELQENGVGPDKPGLPQLIQHMGIPRRFLFRAMKRREDKFEMGKAWTDLSETFRIKRESFNPYNRMKGRLHRIKANKYPKAATLAIEAVSTVPETA